MYITQDQTKILSRALGRAIEIAHKNNCENSLLSFASYVWPVVEPAIPFVKGWAIEAICEHLEAVSYGWIKRLLINVPPGFTKSLMTNVFYPAWEWGPRNMPHLRYVSASYSNSLTERDNLRCRNVVMSDLYTKMWGNRFGISNEQFTKVKFANNKTGWKLATSVSGLGVGERGDRWIVDDANNTMDMESEALRRNTNMWFTEVLPTRLNNAQESAIIVIQQRLHEDDVSGTALSKDMGFTHLCIPMRYEEGRHCVTVLGLDDNGNEVTWEDPRTEDGELAWPERFPEEEVKKLEHILGPYATAGQLQQRPAPRGGSIIKDDYWQLWTEDKYPGFEFIIAALDGAFTAKEENDPSALTVWGVFRDDNDNPKVMLIYAWQGRLEFNQLVQKVTDICTIDGVPKNHPRFPVDRLIIENKATGMSVAQEMYRLYGISGRFGISLFDPRKYGDKVARVHGIEHLFASGMIYAPDRSFADQVIQQFSVFPKGSHDDLVDSGSMALRWLRDTGFMPTKEESHLESEAEMVYTRKPEPLYPV